MAINLDHVTEQITVTDTATDVDLTYITKGAGIHKFNSGGGQVFATLANSASPVNSLVVYGSTNSPQLRVEGASAAIDLEFLSKSTGGFRFFTQGVGYAEQFRIANATSAVNYVQVVGSATSNAPYFITQGSDTNINFAYSAKGSGSHVFYTAGFSFAPQFAVSHTASAVNYVNITGAATGGIPAITAQGSDSNVNLGLWAKNSASVYFYSNGGFAQFEVSPTASAVNRVVVTGAATGSTPYFLTSGSDTNIGLVLATKGSGSLSAWTNSGTTLQFRVADTASSVNYIQVSGAVTGSAPYLLANGSDTDVPLVVTSKGAGTILFKTAGGAPTQFAVTHTASAVNYVQLTGNATTGAPTLSTQGSDTNISLQYVAKGIGVHAFQTGSSFNQFRITATNSSVNYIQVTGAATGVPVQLSAAGSDTNIPLVLQPKGTGALQAQLTDSTATGGNARGANAVDWQTIRGSAVQVAAGGSSVVSGGQNNRAGSPWATVGGGYSHTASGQFSGVLSGYANNATGQSAFVGAGESNTASGYDSAVVAGSGNTAAGYFNFIGNGYFNSATAASAITTQSATMNGTTAVTLSGSNASIKVGQYITGTSIGADTYVAAISGTSLTLSKIASGSSTSTLSFYTPHGVVVGGGNNTATGSYSFIGGGGDAGTAANRNVASGDWSTVGGGGKNVASGIASFVGGGGFDGTVTNGNIASGSYSIVVGGSGNTASGTGSFIGGGNNNVASASNSAVLNGFQNTANSAMSSSLGGRRGITRGIIGNAVFSACDTPMADANGVSQSSLLILARQTTDATATVLCSNSASANTTNQVILPNNSAYTFQGEVVSGVTGGGNSKSWTIEGLIKRGANAASTALVGTPTVTSTYADAGASTWVIAVTADTTNGGLAVTFTGQASTTIRTVAQIRTTEMTY